MEPPTADGHWPSSARAASRRKAWLTASVRSDGRERVDGVTDTARDALTAWLALRGRQGDDWLFPSRSRCGDHLSTRQYARLMDRWVAMIDLEPRAYGTQQPAEDQGGAGLQA